MSDFALDALLQGLMAMNNGDTKFAQDWLERASRLVPGDATMVLAQAGAKLRHNNSDAARLFAAVAHEHDLVQAWLGLALAHHLQGKTDHAAETLSQALSRHAFALGSFAGNADAIAQAILAPGWCNVDGVGRLIVRLAQIPSRGNRPVATLDGEPLQLRSRPDGRDFVARLPDGWDRARTIIVLQGNVDLLGSPIAIHAIVRVEGFADTRDGDLHGWAWCPNDRERDPILTIVPQKGAPISVVADNRTAEIRHRKPLARPRGFHISAKDLRGLDGALQVRGWDGRNLTGSPLDPSAERRSAEIASSQVAGLFPASAHGPRPSAEAIPLLSMSAQIVGSQPSGGKIKRRVDIVVPIYGGLDLALPCLEAVLTDLPRWARVIVIDDASPDPSVGKELGKLAARKDITLLTQVVNRGFPGTANVGMRHDPTRDVVLLNSDTLTPPGWLERLRDVAYSASDIGSATPLANDATILSYPSIEHPNAVPELTETVRSDLLAQLANTGCVVDIPTAVGFCMYIKRDCLNTTGLFRDDLFAQGYGEENDFCIRARHLGWRHVAAPGVFVAHVGGHSFGSTKAYLVERNMRVLNRLHPGYDTLIQDFQKTDPLAEPRRRFDMERWKTFRTKLNSVLLVTHGRGGGVQRHVAERAAKLRSQGLRPIVLWPVASRMGGGRDCVLGDGPEGGTPNLRFAIPKELGLLYDLIKGDRIKRAEVHHLVGHDHALLDLFKRMAIPYEIVIHDYSWFCPRINLMGADNRYCGEPDVAQCETCVSDAGTKIDEDTSPRDLRERSLAELSRASRVITPAEDVATRIQRHFPSIQAEVVDWEKDDDLPPSKPAPLAADGVLRVCVVGAIGIEKGFDVLLACARDVARRKLKLEFRLVGYSCDDARLLATGCVHITGRYEEEEVVGLIRAQHAQLALLTSLWPETWCYTLTQCWRAGLDVVAFDIGVPADRIRRTGRGWLYPLSLPPAALSNRLLELQSTDKLKQLGY
jgi:GT2 family glycosyltransferase/glycosyltransferase involved in cell wall biosynthesis